MSEPEAAQAAETVKAQQTPQTEVPTPQELKTEPSVPAEPSEPAQTRQTSEGTSEIKSAETQVNESQIASSEQKDPVAAAEPEPKAPVETQQATETAGPQTSAELPTQAEKAPLETQEPSSELPSQPTEASEPANTQQPEQKEPQPEAKGDAQANGEMSGETKQEADELKATEESKSEVPAVPAQSETAAETAPDAPTETPAESKEASEREAADGDVSMRDGSEAEADAEGEEPPQKKLKIDSSQVLASVEHFADFVSGVVVYRVHEEPLANVNEDHLNSTIWVRIARCHVSRNNPNVVRRKLWGTEVYTDDSDIVAALYHCNLVEEGESDLMVSVKLLPRLLKYQGCFLNDVNSRSWDRHHDGISYKIVDVKPLPRGSAEYPASERLARVQQWEKEYAQQKSLRATLNF